VFCFTWCLNSPASCGTFVHGATSSKASADHVIPAPTRELLLVADERLDG
jgi:hypothetical protein